MSNPTLPRPRLSRGFMTLLRHHCFPLPFLESEVDTSKHRCTQGAHQLPASLEGAQAAQALAAASALTTSPRVITPTGLLAASITYRRWVLRSCRSAAALGRGSDSEQE